MTMTPIDQNDPRLTAYALGELPEAERAEFEARLAQDPAARQLVDELRAAAETYSDALLAEPAPALLPEQRAAIVPPARRRLRLLPWVGTLAACLAVAAILWQSWPQLTGRDTDRLSLLASAETVAPSNLPSQVAQIPAVEEEVTEDAETAQAHEPGPATSTPAPAADLKRPAHGKPAPAVLAPATPPAPEKKDRREPGAQVIDESSLVGGLTEGYNPIRDNPFVRVTDEPLSTFAIDVDTASYANVRRFLTQGQRPPADAVRIEELVNYFDYDYPQPRRGQPFGVTLEVAGCPWAPQHRLLRVGLQGRTLDAKARPPVNLVFLLDVSGSMSSANKLPLVREAMKLLVEQLRAEDRVAIAVYAGASGMVLESTPGDQYDTIVGAFDRLQAGGSTNGGAGITLAYETAKQHFIRGGANRVILCTDGDFNVGVTSQGDLIRMVEERAKDGVFLTVFGFGMGNLKDGTLEQLANKGNGIYGYIDTMAEARKWLVDGLMGTLVTIAKDVKAQVEFNPAQVTAYRLIGYENRLLAKEDFNDDTKDAGEIGAGHTVTALYEIVPAGVTQANAPPAVDPLKYQDNPPAAARATGDAELLTLKLRYKQPDEDQSTKLEFPLVDEGRSYGAASGDFKFAAAVAAFGMILRDSPHRGTTSLGAVLELAEEGQGHDPKGYRKEFLDLVRKAQALLPAGK
jgi:Ca-activated chloride channel family protein